MPAKDRYHTTVIHALQKDGWVIEKEQFPLDVAERRLWVDIRAYRGSTQLAILVEVKGLNTLPSPVENLANAIGKYTLYKAALKITKDSTPLYLAIPLIAYNGIVSEPLAQQALADTQAWLLVFDPEREAVVQWIP